MRGRSSDAEMSSEGDLCGGEASGRVGRNAADGKVEEKVAFCTWRRSGLTQIEIDCRIDFDGAKREPNISPLSHKIIDLSELAFFFNSLILLTLLRDFSNVT